MGLFQVEIEVLPADGGSPYRQSVPVDAGASYLALPRSLLLSSPKLLGARTLETFGLGVDPLGKRLVPGDAYLA